MECRFCHNTNVVFSNLKNGRLSTMCDTCRQRNSEISKRHNRAKYLKEKNYAGPDSYNGRKAALLEIGYQNYESYLTSGLWYAIRQRLEAEKGATCFLCPRPKECWHHNRYGVDDLLGNNLNHIVPLCHSCHESLEYDHNGKKRKMKKVVELYERRRKKFKTKLRARS